jgi:hypothetical protein
MASVLVNAYYDARKLSEATPTDAALAAATAAALVAIDGGAPAGDPYNNNLQGLMEDAMKQGKVLLPEAEEQSNRLKYMQKGVIPVHVTVCPTGWDAYKKPVRKADKIIGAQYQRSPSNGGGVCYPPATARQSGEWANITDDMLLGNENKKLFQLSPEQLLNLMSTMQAALKAKGVDYKLPPIFSRGLSHKADTVTSQLMTAQDNMKLNRVLDDATKTFVSLQLANSEKIVSLGSLEETKKRLKALFILNIKGQYLKIDKEAKDLVKTPVSLNGDNASKPYVDYITDAKMLNDFNGISKRKPINDQGDLIKHSRGKDGFVFVLEDWLQQSTSVRNKLKKWFQSALRKYKKVDPIAQTDASDWA